MGAAQTPGFPSISWLLIDDGSVTLYIATNSLQNWGAEVHELPSNQE
jgi:hypothetical protein